MDAGQVIYWFFFHFLTVYLQFTGSVNQLLPPVYMTPLSTGGRSPPSPAPSCSPTPEDSDPENNVVLYTKELEARIEVFLEEVEEDLEINDLPPLENASPLPVPAPVFPGFVPFAMSTGQCCIPPKSLLRKVYHPYQDPVG